MNFWLQKCLSASEKHFLFIKLNLLMSHFKAIILKFPTSKNLIGMISKLGQSKNCHIWIVEKNLKRLDSKKC